MTVRRAPCLPPALPALCAGLALAFGAAGAGVAGDCPEARLDTARESALIESLRAATDPGQARRFNDALWELWTDAPDDYAQNLLDSGMSRIRLGDLSNAVKAFDALVEYCPGYAEGYNQRAFARFLQDEFEAALVDLDAALARSPRHVGALSGKALTLMGLGEDRAALAALRDALALNPHLSEGALVPVLEERLGEEKL